MMGNASDTLTFIKNKILNLVFKYNLFLVYFLNYENIFLTKKNYKNILNGL